MKKTVKITLCGIITALSVVVMLFSYFPYLTYTIPAAAGLLTMVLVIEVGLKWAACAYVASAALIFIFAEPESKLMYICFFGYYPIFKALIESLKKPWLEWLVKIMVFNAAILAVYCLFSGAFGISTEDFGAFGKISEALFLLAGNVVFVAYDIAVSRVSVLYMSRIHPKIKSILLK